jgi:hypothetical protein
LPAFIGQNLRLEGYCAGKAVRSAKGAEDVRSIEAGSDVCVKVIEWESYQCCDQIQRNDIVIRTVEQLKASVEDALMLKANWQGWIFVREYCRKRYENAQIRRQGNKQVL